MFFYFSFLFLGHELRSFPGIKGDGLDLSLNSFLLQKLVPLHLTRQKDKSWYNLGIQIQERRSTSYHRMVLHLEDIKEDLKLFFMVEKSS